MTICVEVDISNPSSRERRHVGAAHVNTASMLSWLPRQSLESLGIRPEREWEFQRADGTIFTRSSGTVIVHVEDRATIDDVIVCEDGDEPSIGWRTLSGLNLRLDEETGRLVDGGPVPAATAASAV